MPDSLDLGALNLRLDSTDDAGGDFVLQVENVIQAPVVAISPDVVSGGRVNQLGADPDPVSAFLAVPPKDRS